MSQAARQTDRQNVNITIVRKEQTLIETHLKTVYHHHRHHHHQYCEAFFLLSTASIHVQLVGFCETPATLSGHPFKRWNTRSGKGNKHWIHLIELSHSGWLHTNGAFCGALKFI